MNDHGHGRGGFIFVEIEQTIKIKIVVFHSLFFGFPLIITATQTKVETYGERIPSWAHSSFAKEPRKICHCKILIDNLTVTQLLWDIDTIVASGAGEN